MTVIYYESSDSDFEGFEDFDEQKDAAPGKTNQNSTPKPSFSSYISQTKKYSLPPPKKKLIAPPPPEPVKIIQPVIAEAKQNDESNEIIFVDAEAFQEKDTKLAMDNAMVKDKTAYHGVGRQREKSQLSYLSEVYLKFLGIF